jgi:hypothetical protein
MSCQKLPSRGCFEPAPVGAPRSWSALRGPSHLQARQPPGLEHSAATAPAGRRARNRLVARGCLPARETDPCGAPHAILGSSDLVGQAETLDQLKLVHGPRCRAAPTAAATTPWRPSLGRIRGRTERNRIAGIGHDARSLAKLDRSPVEADFERSAFSRRSLPRTATHARRPFVHKLAQPTLLSLIRAKQGTGRRPICACRAMMRSADLAGP